MTEDATLIVEGLKSGYGEISVLQGISFEGYAGRILGIVGPNGAGKTTAISTIGGLIRARAGRVVIAGVDCTSTPAWRRARLGLAVVQEGKRTLRDLTVQENLELATFSSGKRRRVTLDALEPVLAEFPVLKGRLGERAGALSGGQQQMLAVAQALAARPKVVLVDEPSGGLAPMIVDEVFASLRRVANDGVCVLVVEQTVEHIKAVADAMCVMFRGEIVWSGDPRSEDAGAALDEVYFGVSAEHG